jgi:hypothetical protein
MRRMTSDDTNNIWECAAYVAVTLSLAGNVGVVQRKRWGMAVWIIANIIWVSYHTQRRNWPSVSLFGAYLVLSIWGYARWKRPAQA